MKRSLLIPLIALVVFQSCGTQRYCQPSKRSKDYAVKLLDSGTISQAITPIKVEVISIKRTMKGFKHTFVSDKGDTIVRFFPKPLKQKLYLIRSA